ncbi:single-stranded DNA-binding protein [Sorangium cellulosum]|uniref:Single-stranded DNA-binding protein n=1 Tax=Sorangium cellulosum TaxID=56 RepID=A0A4V0NE70_SORCE|nr:single-stranded DNA-binding protein [Sorangium cellulosum]AUX25142.1 single-stranded DNA-binding protein [Sorangium cellulosum]
MAYGINRVILAGNLGADPDLRHTQSGQAVLNLRMATTEPYFDKNGEKKERTDWHSVTLWNKRAEALASILRKGSQILVEGRLQTSSYDDREGNKRYKTEVVATNLVLLDKRSGGGQGRDDYQPSGSPGLGSTDDIPF